MTFGAHFRKKVKDEFPDVKIIEHRFLGLAETPICGYHFIFPNGNVASVQFGPGTYCTNGRKGYGDFEKALNGESLPHYATSPDAEIAAFNSKKEFIDFGWGDDVLGDQTPEQVLEWLKKVKRRVY